MLRHNKIFRMVSKAMVETNERGILLYFLVLYVMVDNAVPFFNAFSIQCSPQLLS
jgi:hypothetical protein